MKKLFIDSLEIFITSVKVTWLFQVLMISSLIGGAYLTLVVIIHSAFQFIIFLCLIVMVYVTLFVITIFLSYKYKDEI